MMTKKDFNKLASAIRYIDIARQDKRKVALAIGVVCKLENPRFDWSTWHEACDTVSILDRPKGWETAGGPTDQ
jgi:hypothetical protein